MRAPAWLCLVAVAACGGSRPKQAPPEPEPPKMFRATVRWTGFGVPHVTAADPAGLGFGQGWATAKQHVCRLADQFVRVRAERARWFGPGPDDANLDSDFFHLQLGLDARARELVTTMSKDARDLARGWVAGYNHYVTHRSREWPEACRDAAWVRPIDELDLARLDLGLAATASSRRFETQIARAAPGDANTASLPFPPEPPLASNGWALGGDRTETGAGLVVANPHFPWQGDLTFSEIHLTIPGELDVYGATIPGVPMVGIGFTPKVAWTHTFSSSTRFLLYRLRLVDGDPTRYVRDDGEGRILGKTFEIGVLQPDGSIEQVQRTMYRSGHGPMVTSAFTPWDAEAAYAIADVALDSAGSVIDLYLGFARAEGLDDFRAAMGFHATPFLNTIYADLDGNAWYVDGSAVPNLSDEGLIGWELARKAVPELEAAWQQHVAVVDGSSSMFDLITDDPAYRGTIPLAAAPELLRRDFVFNANDSYGYTNPDAPLTGFSPFYGDATASPSPRGLMNLRMLREKGVASASGSDWYFGRAEAAGAMLSNRSFTGEQLRDEVHARCLAEDARRAAPKPEPRKGKARKGKAPAGQGSAAPPQPPRLDKICSRLAEWDLRFDVDSRGAVLWRELIEELGLPWAVEFDPQAPSTPSGLAAVPPRAPDPVIAALERAVAVLSRAGVDYRSATPTLGELQRAAIGSGVGVPGGIGGDGVASVATWVDADDTLLPHATRAPAISGTGLGPDGYPVNYGTSWVMSVELRPEGPVADVLMTYGPPRAADGVIGPDSDDQLVRFGQGALRPALFDDAAISEDPDLVVEHLEEEQAL